MTTTERTQPVDPREILSPGDMRRAIEELGERPSVCPLCGAHEPKRIFDKSGKSFFRCNACELVFVHAIYPEFTEDVEHLEETYHFGELSVAKGRQLKNYQSLMATFEPYRETGRLLEVGCGQGMFLAHAQESGWSASGIDVLPAVVEVARERRGLDVHLGELHEAALPDDHFDVVFMSEVIEHIVDPIGLMREVRRVLRPGGIALLGTGNAGSWSARWRGAGWCYYRFGGHLHIRFYSPKSAQALADVAGFSSVECETRSFAFRESEELEGQWYKPLCKVAQGVISPFAGPFGAGHRLRMKFTK